MKVYLQCPVGHLSHILALYVVLQLIVHESRTGNLESPVAAKLGAVELVVPYKRVSFRSHDVGLRPLSRLIHLDRTACSAAPHNHLTAASGVIRILLHRNGKSLILLYRPLRRHLQPVSGGIGGELAGSLHVHGKRRCIRGKVFLSHRQIHLYVFRRINRLPVISAGRHPNSRCNKQTQYHSGIHCSLFYKRKL